MPNKPELLSPAGDPERLQMAVRYGADAVYLAGKPMECAQNAAILAIRSSLRQ